MSFPSVKQDLVQYLTNLQANFKERFPELEEVSCQHVQFPFRVNAEACGDLALEVAELQADENQKILFEDSDLASFWLNAPKKQRRSNAIYRPWIFARNATPLNTVVKAD